MKNYLVIIKVDVPPLLTFEEKVEASSPATALGRVYRKLRKDRLKKKRIKKWDIQIIALS